MSMKLIVGSFFLLCSVLVFGAMAPQVPQKLAFEVATVKLIDPNDSVFVTMSADPSIVRYGNLTLRDAIRGAYKVNDFQIAGPDWMSSVRFQVDARLPAGAATDQIPEMFQALLEERFKLTWRREPKEMQVYALLVGKDGPKLKPAQAIPPNQSMAMGTDGRPRAGVVFGGSLSQMTITAPHASLLTLVGVASRFTSRPVVDATGIDGDYDFTLTFAAETDAGLPQGFQGNPALSEPAPSLAEAVKKYGLRIEPRKETIDMFVITHVERKPSEN
jgi:uncharacterized protein (TIGR03435 family)